MVIDKSSDLLNYTYKEIVEYLLQKYGPAKYTYFRTNTCKSKNPKVSRTKEGLFCHHIDENRAILLSEPEFAQKNPWAYQQSDRLVYCNYLEHLIIHAKIFEESKNGSEEHHNEILGLGGVLLISEELYKIYSGYRVSGWREYVATPILSKSDEFTEIVEYVKEIIKRKSCL